MGQKLICPIFLLLFMKIYQINYFVAPDLINLGSVDNL